ncbi:25336_t:CDS:2, partial [Dentiscutata erythropus]
SSKLKQECTSDTSKEAIKDWPKEQRYLYCGEQCILQGVKEFINTILLADEMCIEAYLKIRAAAVGKSLEKRNEYVLGESQKYDCGMPIGFEFNNYPQLLYLSKILNTIQDYQTLVKGDLEICDSLVEMYVSYLDDEKRSSFIPFKLPTRKEYMFKYLSYVTSIPDNFYCQVGCWYKRFSGSDDDPEDLCSALILLLLNLSKNMKSIILVSSPDKMLVQTICGKNSLKNLYLHFCLSNITARSISKMCKVKSLRVLEINGYYLRFRPIKDYMISLQTNTIMKSLSFIYDSIDNDNSIHLIADVIFKNTTLSQLKIGGSGFSIKRFVLLIKSLKSNTSLNSLSLKNNYLGLKEIMVLKDYLIENNTLLVLDLSFNELDFECGKLLSEVITKNHTLLRLNLGFNCLGSKGGKFIMDSLPFNNMLLFLNLKLNKIEFNISSPNSNLKIFQNEFNEIERFIDNSQSPI